MSAILFALVASALAALLVYCGWRQGRSARAAGAGWLLALGSLPLWSRALGVEFGVSYAIIVFTCLAWALVFWQRESGPQAAAPELRPLRMLQRPALRDGVSHSLRFVLAVPVAGACTMLLSAALVLPLPWSLPLQLAVAIFLYPLLWGALSAWICAQDKLLPATLVNVALAVLSSLILYL